MENSSVNSSKKQTLEFVRLSVTLFVIAGVMALIVALVNNITAPVIAGINEKKTAEALLAVLPEADGFTDITGEVELVGSVENVWRAQNDAGFCVKVCPQGYGGAIETIVGFDKDGAVVGTEIISMSETSGIGTKIQEASFLDQFKGISSTASVTTISGATRSSKAFVDGIDSAIAVVSQLTGGEDNE